MNFRTVSVYDCTLALFIYYTPFLMIYVYQNYTSTKLHNPPRWAFAICRLCIVFSVLYLSLRKIQVSKEKKKQE